MSSPTPRIHFLAELPKPPVDRPRVGCSYPKLGQLRRTDTSNKALARSPKFDFAPTLPQFHDDESLAEAITDALTKSPDEYESLCARSLFNECSQASETSDGSCDGAQIKLKPLTVAEVARPVHREELVGRSYRFRKLLDILSTPARSVTSGESRVQVTEREKALPMPPTMACQISSGSSTSGADTSSSDSSSPESSRPPSVFA